MQTDKAIIYVAGAPEFYPLEYYDPDSQSYQGAIPAFLEQFAQEYGYDLRYFRPGPEDHREELAANRQVDLISGCVGEERYPSTAWEPLTLFYSGAAGEETACQLQFTQVASAGFQSDLREYVARTSQEEWTGAIVQAAGQEPAQPLSPGVLWGAGLLFLALTTALIVSFLRFRRAKERRRAQDSRTDPETGLGTRDVLEQAFSSTMQDQSRMFYSLICFHLDLDRVGYLCGQERALELFRHGAQVLTQAADPSDTLARSGEDLVVLKRAPDQRKAAEWANSVAEQLNGLFPCGTAAWNVSAGIYPLEIEFQDFDHAMFYARQCALDASRGGTGCRLCDTKQFGRFRERRQLLDDFSRALEREEFQLYLQFFVDANTFWVVGGEALSRWHHPRLGLLNPDRYIPFLEEAGRIGDLDFYGLEKVCGFLDELERQQIRDFFISCNFTRKTFCSPDFAQRCIEIVQRYSFTRKLLILEVTESQRLNSSEMAQMLQNITAIREFGVRVIFDDFGVGFSTFHDLQDYPMDGLKLDKDLMDNMWTEKGWIILNALVETGHRIGMTVLAEGVEEEWQVEILQSLHCDVIQGFYFSVPLPAGEVRKQILAGARFRGKSDGQK